jgi:hypothetical protein
MTTRDPLSPQWEDCKVCGGDHWTKDHPNLRLPPVERCPWCGKTEGHRPNCPRPLERFTARDMAEAVAAEKARLREAVRALPDADALIERRAVLALIEP